MSAKAPEGRQSLAEQVLDWMNSGTREQRKEYELMAIVNAHEQRRKKALVAIQSAIECVNNDDFDIMSELEAAKAELEYQEKP